MRLEPGTVQWLDQALKSSSSQVTCMGRKGRVVYDPAFSGGPVRVDFEDTPVELAQLNGRGGIEPSFGGYKKIVEVGGFVLHGMFPIMHCAGSIWLCAVDVIGYAVNKG